MTRELTPNAAGTRRMHAMCKPSTHLMHPLSAPIQSSRHLLTSSLPGANEKARFPLLGINQVASVPQHLFNSLSCLESQAERTVRLGMGVLCPAVPSPTQPHTPQSLSTKQPDCFQRVKGQLGCHLFYRLRLGQSISEYYFQFSRIKHHDTQKEVTNREGTICLINVHFKLFDWMLPLSTHLK